MIVIVSNKQKSALDNANIDAIKDLNGLFNVQDLINNFKNYFFTKMVIDATSIVDFTNPEVLKQLANGIGSEKLIVLLPPKPEPPLRFLETLVNIGIYNFSTNIDEIVKMIENPYDYDAVNRKIHNTGQQPGNANNNVNNNNINNNGNINNNNINNINNGFNNMPQGIMNNNNPDRNMNMMNPSAPQSAAKKDIINLSDFVMSEAPKMDQSMDMQNQGMQMPINQPMNQGMGMPMDDINSVRPIDDNNTMMNMGGNMPYQDINQVTPINQEPMNMGNMMMNNVQMVNNPNNGGFLNDNSQGGFIGYNEAKGLIVGFRNVTEHAGTTTLLYKMKETIEERNRKRVALVEVGSNDFMFFKLNDVSAINEADLDNCLNNLQTRYDYIFVDLNNTNNDSICNFVLYLVEPSKIRINKLIVQNRDVFNSLKNKYVILNKSMLTENEKGRFSQEANLPFYASVGPFNDRAATNAIDELISKIDSEKNNLATNTGSNNQSQGFLGF